MCDATYKSVSFCLQHTRNKVWQYQKRERGRGGMRYGVCLGVQITK